MARALAIDTKDNLLVVSNEGTGTLVLVSLTSNSVGGRINAVRANPADDQDDHSDHDGAPNAPSIGTLSPLTAKAGASLTVTITGTNLTGATGIVFIDPAALPGKGVEDNHADTAFTVTNIRVTGGGTQLTATVAIAAAAKAGPRLVKVMTPNGETSSVLAATDTLTVIP